MGSLKIEADIYRADDAQARPVPGVFSRGRLYLYVRQNGLWTREITRFDPATEKKKLDPYCPVRNSTPDYPPIIMLHGTDDTDVPCEESREMVEPLTKNRARHGLFVVPGGDHRLNRGDRAMITKGKIRGREFVKEVLGSASGGRATSQSAEGRR